MGPVRTLVAVIRKKKDLIEVKHSGELFGFGQLDSTVLQDVCKLLETIFTKFVAVDYKEQHSDRIPIVKSLHKLNERARHYFQ